LGYSRLMSPLQILKGKQVEIVYQGVLYKGVLVDADETSLHLKTGDCVVILPMSDVSDMREGYEPK